MKFNEYHIRILNNTAEEMAIPVDTLIGLVKTLRRASATLHRIAENDCNGHPIEVMEMREGKTYRFSVENAEWKARDEKTESRIMKNIRALSEKHGFLVDFQGDPRGAVVKVSTMSGRDFTDLIY